MGEPRKLYEVELIGFFFECWKMCEELSEGANCHFLSFYIRFFWDKRYPHIRENYIWKFIAQISSSDASNSRTETGSWNFGFKYLLLWFFLLFEFLLKIVRLSSRNFQKSFFKRWFDLMHNFKQNFSTLDILDAFQGAFKLSWKITKR
jgi:hypothetical protein